VALPLALVSLRIYTENTPLKTKCVLVKIPYFNAAPIIVVLRSNVGLRLTLISLISLCNTLSVSLVSLRIYTENTPLKTKCVLVKIPYFNAAPIIVVLRSNVGLRLTLISLISLCNTLSVSVQNVRRNGP
jgi:hypothetical protein